MSSDRAGIDPQGRELADAAGATAGASRVPGPTAPARADVARVLRQFRIVVSAIKSHQQLTERQAGLTGAQVWALHLIASQPGLGIKGLSQALDVRQPTASILAKALVQLGLVETVRQADDRRAARLQVTPAGQAVLAHAPGPFTGVLPAALARLDANVLGQLSLGLERLIQELPADPRNAQMPLSPLSSQPPT